MIKLSEYILDAIADTKLFEMAFTRKQYIMKLMSLQDPINKHILKLIVYNDTRNERKHIKDVSSWMRDITNMKMKKRGSGYQPKEDFFFEYLFILPFDGDESVLKKWLEALDDDYGTLPKHTDDVSKVMKKLIQVHTEVAKALAEGSFNFDSIWRRG